MPKAGSKRITPRRQRVIVENVMAAVAIRDELRSKAAQRRQFDREQAPWRRITGKLVAFAIFASMAGVVIAHALAG